MPPLQDPCHSMPSLAPINCRCGASWASSFLLRITKANLLDHGLMPNAAGRRLDIFCPRGKGSSVTPASAPVFTAPVFRHFKHDYMLPLVYPHEQEGKRGGS